MEYHIYVPAKIIAKHDKIKNITSIKPFLEIFSSERIRTISDVEEHGMKVVGYNITIQDEDINDFCKKILKLDNFMLCDLHEFIELSEDSYDESYIITDEHNKKTMIVNFRTEDDLIIAKIKNN